MAIGNGLVNKTNFIPFIDFAGGDSPAWTQIKKSTSFSLSMNPVTKTYDFIESAGEQEELDSYKPSLAQSLTMFKGEADFEKIFAMCYHLPTADAAHKDALLVFYHHSYTASGGGGTKYYAAWKADSIIKINTLDSVNQSIDFDIPLNKHDEGAVTIVESNGAKTPTWVAGTWSADMTTFTPANG